MIKIVKIKVEREIIEYCCKTLEEATRHIICHDKNNIFEDNTVNSNKFYIRNDYCFFQLDYCPFCGEKLEIERSYENENLVTKH